MVSRLDVRYMSFKTKLLETVALYAIGMYADKFQNKPKKAKNKTSSGTSQYVKKEKAHDKLEKLRKKMNKRHYLFVTRVSESDENISDNGLNETLAYRAFDKDDMLIYTIRKNKTADTFSLYSEKNRKLGFVTTQNELLKTITRAEYEKCAVYRNQSKLCAIKKTNDTVNNHYSVSESKMKVRIKHKNDSHFYAAFNDKEFEILRTVSFTDWFMEGHPLEYIIGFNSKGSDLSALVLIAMGLEYLS